MTAAFAIRDEMNAMIRTEKHRPGKVWFWELERAVIDAGRCVQCGVCIAACPSDSLGIGADDLPKLVKMCTGCSLCWDFCPRGGLRYEALGEVMGVLTDEQWQYGGVAHPHPHPPAPPPPRHPLVGTRPSETGVGTAEDRVIPSGAVVLKER